MTNPPVYLLFTGETLPDTGFHGIMKPMEATSRYNTDRTALFGEAVVAPHAERLPHFFPLIKQHGALLAKGRLLGIQFETLFTDGIYLEMGKHAVRLAQKLKQGFVQKGYKLHMDSPTNQQFVCLPNADIDRLSAHATFELWGPRGEEETVVRFVTSWATREADVDALIDLL